MSAGAAGAVSELIGVALHCGADPAVRELAVDALRRAETAGSWHDALKVAILTRADAGASFDLDVVAADVLPHDIPASWLANLTTRAAELSPERVRALAGNGNGARVSATDPAGETRKTRETLTAWGAPVPLAGPAEAPPLPRDAMPEALAEVVFHVAEETQAPS
ncbi:MAG: hypothetical protein ACYDA8_18935, partial [Deferrisomatales bacterium]